MLLNHSGSNKAEWFRTDSGTSYQLSKSRASLSSRVATKQLDEYRENTSSCQRLKEKIFVISTSGRPHGKHLKRCEMQSNRIGIAREYSWLHDFCLQMQTREQMKNKLRLRTITVSGRFPEIEAQVKAPRSFARICRWRLITRVRPVIRTRSITTARRSASGNMLSK